MKTKKPVLETQMLFLISILGMNTLRLSNLFQVMVAGKQRSRIKAQGSLVLLSVFGFTLYSRKTLPPPTFDSHHSP